MMTFAHVLSFIPDEAKTNYVWKVLSLVPPDTDASDAVVDHLLLNEIRWLCAQLGITEAGERYANTVTHYNAGNFHGDYGAARRILDQDIAGQIVTRTQLLMDIRDAELRHQNAWAELTAAYQDYNADRVAEARQNRASAYAELQRLRTLL